jgi:hypothetical protein
LFHSSHTREEVVKKFGLCLLCGQGGFFHVIKFLTEAVSVADLCSSKEINFFGHSVDRILYRVRIKARSGESATAARFVPARVTRTKYQTLAVYQPSPRWVPRNGCPGVS